MIYIYVCIDTFGYALYTATTPAWYEATSTTQQSICCRQPVADRVLVSAVSVVVGIEPMDVVYWVNCRKTAKVLRRMEEREPVPMHTTVTGGACDVTPESRQTGSNSKLPSFRLFKPEPRKPYRVWRRWRRKRQRSRCYNAVFVHLSHN